jgi:hypothetical protein
MAGIAAWGSSKKLAGLGTSLPERTIGFKGNAATEYQRLITQHLTALK